jgi:hypothetical protein
MSSLRDATPTPMHNRYFAGDVYDGLRLRSFSRTAEAQRRRGAENTEEGDKRRFLRVSDIAFLFRAKSQRSDRLLQIFYTCTM